MNFKRGKSHEQNQPRFKKRDPNQCGFNAFKVKVENGSGSQGVNPICGKKHFGKCITGTSGCFGCGKDGHNMSECPSIFGRGREAM